MFNEPCLVHKSEVLAFRCFDLEKKIKKKRKKLKKGRKSKREREREKKKRE